MQCSVPFCSSKSSDASLAQGGVGVTFHEFPREAHFRAAWLRALGKQDCQLPDSAVVCSQHFAALSDVCEIEGGARQLRSDAVPSAVLVCMTCLNTDGKMFPMSQHSLRRAYEQLTGYPPCDGGYMKLTLCAQCAQYLRNFTRFREQSLRARCLMMELLEKHEVITLQHITMIQHENNHPKKNLVSTMLGPDPCDMYIADNTDEDRQTGSEETALGVAVKTECSDVSQFVNEDKQEINEENNYADCVSEELAEHPLNSESAAFVCTVCCEEFSHEHAYSAHARTHLHDDASDSRAPDSDHTTDTELKSCVVKLYDILKYPQNAKVKVESSPPTLQTASSRDSLYAHTAREDAQHRAASEDEVAATHEEPAASVLSGTEPGTSGSSSLAHTLTCHDCQRVFSGKHNLIAHMWTHTGEKPYSCKLCSYKFTEKRYLVTHMRTHTDGTGNPYSCKLCSYKFTEKRHLVTHMRSHTGEKPYSFKLCSYKCTRKSSLDIHMRIHTGEKPYSCKLCSYKCIDTSRLYRHMKIHTSEKPYSCELCSYKCTEKRHLVPHMANHTGEKPYSCVICSYKCTEKNRLVRHIRTHTGEKPYSCKLCSYKCIDTSRLYRHMKIHTSEKPYSCELCSYKCTEKRHLVPHMANHTGEKPYSCVICSYKCTEKNRLVRHIRTHTGEKPYSCKLCSYKSIQKDKLMLHMRTHTGEKPYSCNLCNFKFTQKGSLNRHMRVHTGEKPYSCKLCSYKCTEKGNLVFHSRTHTGERPYSCILCPYKYSKKSNLMSHMKIHFNE